MPTTNRIIEQGKIPSEQFAPPSTSAHVTRRLPTGRKRLYILGTLLLVLAVLSGSFVFEFQQFEATKARTPILAPILTAKNTPFTQSSQVSLSKPSPTKSSKKCWISMRRLTLHPIRRQHKFLGRRQLLVRQRPQLQHNTYCYTSNINRKSFQYSCHEFFSGLPMKLMGVQQLP